MSHFDFKQFRIYHDRCAMKVGTDGVLLGAWSPVGEVKNILDIGTGSGLVALMLAQRSEANVIGIELDEDAANQAETNAQASPFSTRIKIIQSDIAQYFPEEKFDLIVSNPPFFNEALISPDKQRTQARHTNTLPFEVLIDSAYRLLETDGYFSVILPTSEADVFTNICIVKHFTPIHITSIQTTPKKAPKRKLLCFKKGVHQLPLHTDTLILSMGDGKRSEAYQELTKDFYL